MSIDPNILAQFKNMNELTEFLSERINSGVEISRGKNGLERSKEAKAKMDREKHRDLRRRGYREETEIEEAEKKAHDRNTKTKETEVKKHANGGETHKTIEKEPMPDQDMEQEQPPEEQPPAPPPVQTQPGSQVKIGRKVLDKKIEPTAKKITVSKEEQKINVKPKVMIDTKKDIGVNK